MTELAQSIKALGKDRTFSLHTTHGELSAYNPQAHAGKFLLPLHRDSSDQPIETGYVPIATMFSGPAQGMQFEPVAGAQAIIFFMDGQKFFPVLAVLVYNAVEHPPFTDGKSRGWLDSKSNAIKTTDDGSTPGDGAGGARMVGTGYASVVAPKVELGAEGLDASQDAVMTVRMFKNWITSVFDVHLHGGVTTGAGSTAVPNNTGSTPTGSSKVKASP